MLKELLGRLRQRNHEALGFFRRDLSVSFAGHALSKGLGWLTWMVVLRRLHPAELALIALTDTVLQVAFQVSELGLETGVTRFVAKGLRRHDHDRVDRVLKGVFWTKLLTGTLLFLAGQALVPVAAGLLERPEAAPYFRVGLLGIFGMHLIGFYQAYFSAHLRFAENALFVTLPPLVIFAAMSGAWLLQAVSAWTCVWIYALAPLVVAVGFALTVDHDFLRRPGAGLEALRSVWGFSRWVYLTGTLGEIRFRLNTVFLSRLKSDRDLGLYYSGDKLASTLTLFTATILTVYVPRASHLKTREEMRELLRRSYRYVALLLPPLALLPLLVWPLFPLVLPRYTEAAPYFAVLFISVLFSLAAMPAKTVLYSLNRAEVETAVEGLALVLTLVLGYLLVRTHGPLGASLAMLLQRLVSSLVLVSWVYLKVYRRQAEEAG